MTFDMDGQDGNGLQSYFQVLPSFLGKITKNLLVVCFRLEKITLNFSLCLMWPL